MRGTESASGQYISIIDKNQPQTDLVMDFVMFWLSGPGYQIFVDGAAAAHQFVPAGKIMVRDVRIPGRLVELFDSVAARGNSGRDWNQLFVFAPPGSRALEDGQQILAECVKGRLSLDEAAQRFQQVMHRAVRDRLERQDLPLKTLDHPELDPNR